MAQYKVPQDVEADDKLLGPFTFRQFVYLLIAGGLIALAVGLFQIFPILAIIPLPFVLLLAALALPLKKDQPMETYLAAIVSYYLKPRVRRWTPGQRESTIAITVPKKKEEARTRDITGEEATHRLSFLADIVDTEGYAIKGASIRKVNEELVQEANLANDMFEDSHFESLESTIAKDENERHVKVVQEMREAIEENGRLDETVIQERDDSEVEVENNNLGPNYNSPVVVVPGSEIETEEIAKSNMIKESAQNVGQIKVKPSIIELASNTDYSVATISKEAKRLNERDEGEVFISLH